MKLKLADVITMILDILVSRSRFKTVFVIVKQCASMVFKSTKEKQILRSSKRQILIISLFEAVFTNK